MKNIKICMIGAGRVGKNHSRILNGYVPGSEIIAIVDPVEEFLKVTADEFGIPNRYASLDQALEKCDFDAVVITTPTPTHTSLAILAANKGKHVFLEKPMALNLNECDEIIASTKAAGVHLQIGFMRRFSPEFAAAYERIQAGEIGDVMMVKSMTNGPGLPPAWARALETSNGMLAEVNSHDWDSVRWLMGSNFQRIYTEVANIKGKANNVDTPNFYDNAIVNIKYENGCLGSISGICPCGYGYDARVEVFGTLGIMQIGEMQGQSVVVCTNRDQGLISPIFRTWSERFIYGYVNEMKHFLNCIQTDTEPSISGEDGRWAVAGVLAATKSMLENRPVTLDEIFQ
jgi:predicted dehydrogenase